MSDSLALSALDWWVEAGVDTIVDDCPRDWLATAAPSVVPPAPIVPPPAPSPQDLASFRRWLLADASVPGPTTARIDAMGDADSGIAVVVDMPEAGDRAAGQILSGEAGALFDRMLTAMGLARTGLYLLPFAPARPPAGKVAAADVITLAPLLRRHLALARPRRLLLLGDAPTRALLDLPLAQARGEVRQVEIDGASIPTIATAHPRLVLDRPDYRKTVWTELQLFMTLGDA
ncbi:uracil-DNA glycosylase family protein [Sphingomonas nostoxanthinifaciens]|uniref:uracil-DNA glycosylase family protein n=1 Tax=Sphingomonas nostoxanthinifaciens TaxID=2872652 RepID=UPI001CC1D0BB|nr:uracil-DNA glycosylase family protein [Sphingomonas nostoxanthinifaciens]UAK26203.1 uracil-DNA glycosylase [Sphingomonas nostoxanthinifaciens]